MDWLPFSDGFHYSLFWQELAQTPTPTNSPSPQIDLLRQQIEFLAKENARQGQEFLSKLQLLAVENQQLSERFKEFIVVIGILSSVAIAVIRFTLGNSYKEVKETVQAAITQQIEERMAAIADSRIEMVRRSLEREEVVDQATVEYWLLDAQETPRELKVLRTRGFEVQFCKEPPNAKRRNIDVVVLDLNNSQNPQGQLFAQLPPNSTEQLQELKRQVDLLLDSTSGRTTVFVIYVSGRYNYLDEVGKDRWVAPTNNPITLVGMVVDAAYLAAAYRQ